MKPALLFLCHRIPYPPNKGDKIRAFNMLSMLKEKYKIFLGTFVDSESDWAYVDKLKSWCEDVCIVDLKPRQAEMRSALGLLTGQPLTIPYYYNTQIESWVNEVIERYSIERAFIVSSSMAQYVDKPAFGKLRRVIDLVDVDSDKWRQFSNTKPWPLSWVFRREARYLMRYERDVAEKFDATIFVSKVEADLFCKLAPSCIDKIRYITNGVDTEYFMPDTMLSRPFLRDELALVFVGTMDYWPNVDAVTWFARYVFPQILAAIPNARFYIVGRNPSNKVRALQNIEGVLVVGDVVDVRPYLQHAKIVLAPMRISRGIQNKILEAMAMNKTVLVSSSGLAGIEAEAGTDVVVADGADAFCLQAITLLRNKSKTGALGSARSRVCNDYDWKKLLPELIELIEKETSTDCDLDA